MTNLGKIYFQLFSNETILFCLSDLLVSVCDTMDMLLGGAVVRGAHED